MRKADAHAQARPGFMTVSCMSFRNIDDGRLGELLESFLAHLDSDTRLLRAGKRSVRTGIEMLVHPDHAGIDPGRYLERPLTIRRPDRAAQPEFRIVGPCDHVVDVRKS